MGVYKRKSQKRKDGSPIWEFRQTIKGVTYYVPLPEVRTPFQAKVAGADILKKIYEGKYGREGGEIGSYDFARFVDEVYLPHAREHRRRPEQVGYKCTPLKTFFKGKRLRDITLIEIEKFRRARLLICKPVTVKNDIGLLSEIMHFAVDNDYAATNHCRKVKWRRGEVEPARDRVASTDEREKLIRELEDDRETRGAVLLALNCGLRRMGILTLTKADADFKARVVWYTAKGGRRKAVPMNAEAEAVLKELVARSAYPDGRLFGDRYGYSLSFSFGSFKRACARAGIVGLNFHDLRRTFSARIEELTGRAKISSDLLGHSTVQTTQAHYLPENFEAMRRAVDLLTERPNVVSIRREKAG